MLTAEPRIRILIDALAFNVGLPAWPVHGEVYRPGEWLEALILQESSGRPDVRRYEPHLDTRPDGDAPLKDDGPTEDDASWGPMQCLGLNVKAILGASSASVLNYTPLFDWVLGLGFGMVILRQLIRAKEQNVGRALACYNGGTTGDALQLPDHSMRCQRYVNGVEGHATEVRANRLEKGWRYLGGLVVNP